MNEKGKGKGRSCRIKAKNKIPRIDSEYKGFFGASLLFCCRLVVSRYVFG
jgi:hypothetical protein